MTAPLRPSARPAPMARAWAPVAGPVLAGRDLIEERHGGIDTPESHRATETLGGRGWGRVGDTLPAVDKAPVSHVVALQADAGSHDRRSRGAGGVKPTLDRASGPGPCQTASASPPGERKAETGVSAADRMKSAIRPSVAVR